MHKQDLSQNASDDEQSERKPHFPNPPGYPEDPPQIALGLSFLNGTCPHDKIPQLRLSLSNRTDYPITFYKNWGLFVFSHGYTRSSCLFEIRDLTTEKIMEPPDNFYCTFHTPYQTQDYAQEFFTIRPRKTYVLDGSFPLHEKKAGHSYSIRIIEPTICWWAYGTKKQLLCTSNRMKLLLLYILRKNPLERYDLTLQGDIPPLTVTDLGEPAVVHIV
ncbi:hypothetical protein BT63DRAFT_475854 [Microthyrium microscopicum]|uniref:Uncharacterized protein n=1 Tax=Microthyrium microscopicum TaxID=703497 RepID=A0A6A6UNP2_9PEZI|nr:hypothetical protein BT63DRAFT_475854 [Microthyrium microscopicum]